MIVRNYADKNTINNYFTEIIYALNEQTSNTVFWMLLVYYIWENRIEIPWLLFIFWRLINTATALCFNEDCDSIDNCFAKLGKIITTSERPTMTGDTYRLIKLGEDKIYRFQQNKKRTRRWKLSRERERDFIGWIHTTKCYITEWGEQRREKPLDDSMNCFCSIDCLIVIILEWFLMILELAIEGFDNNNLQNTANFNLI